jgi:hypothetical protein
VPIQLNGRTYRFQLDTGSNATIFYGDEAERLGWREPGRNNARIETIRLGGTRLPAQRLVLRPEIKPKPGELAGTVGLDLLEGYVTVLDYPRQHFCLVPRADMPRALFARTLWAPATEIRNGKVFITITVGGEAQDNLFFDTGASYLALSVDFERWKVLTGRSGASDATERVRASSWGRQVQLVGAPTRKPLQVGSAHLGCPTVFYRPDEPEQFRGFPYPAEGSVGNAPFWSEIVVLDLGVWPAFGIVNRSSAREYTVGDVQPCTSETQRDRG